MLVGPEPPAPALWRSSRTHNRVTGWGQTARPAPSCCRGSAVSGSRRNRQPGIKRFEVRIANEGGRGRETRPAGAARAAGNREPAHRRRARPRGQSCRTWPAASRAVVVEPSATAVVTVAGRPAGRMQDRWPTAVRNRAPPPSDRGPPRGNSGRSVRPLDLLGAPDTSGAALYARGPSARQFVPGQLANEWRKPRRRRSPRRPSPTPSGAARPSSGVDAAGRTGDDQPALRRRGCLICSGQRGLRAALSNRRRRTRVDNT